MSSEKRELGTPIIPQSPQVQEGGMTFFVLSSPIATVSAQQRKAADPSEASDDESTET